MNRIGIAPAFVLCAVSFGQSAELSGLIRDPARLGVAGVEITLRNEHTGGRRVTRSNASGFYSLPTLNPGEYRLSVRAPGFETIVREGIRLEVGENARIDFDLRLGESRIEITVSGKPALMNTENGSVGTVVDRNIIDQMPLNGRGIQALIELSPGVVVIPVVDASRGQFAVNGQRSDANYFTVDGVSANFAVAYGMTASGLGGSALGVQAGSGMIPANNFFGTFSNLVSPEALQEFKIQPPVLRPSTGVHPERKSNCSRDPERTGIQAPFSNTFAMTGRTRTIGSQTGMPCLNPFALQQLWRRSGRTGPSNPPLQRARPHFFLSLDRGRSIGTASASGKRRRTLNGGATECAACGGGRAERVPSSQSPVRFGRGCRHNGSRPVCRSLFPAAEPTDL